MIRREQKKDFFYWMDKVMPWFIGGCFVITILWFIGLGVIVFYATDAAVQAGPGGIAESLGRLWADFQRGAQR